MEKEVEKVAHEFEREIERGFQADNRQTFADYAAYVIEMKKRSGVKRRTIGRYLELLERCDREGLEYTWFYPYYGTDEPEVSESLGNHVQYVCLKR